MAALKKNILIIKNNIIICILLFLILLSSLTLLRFQQMLEPVAHQLPLYHFSIVLPNSVDPFWKEVQKGVEEAADHYNAAVEFNAPRFNNSQEELQYLDIAILSKVDGIVTHVSHDVDFTGLINEAYDQEIPVVTIENDAADSKRKAFVGTNSYLLGETAGKLLCKAARGKANIAIIMNNDEQKDKASKNLKITGFLNAIEGYRNMKVVEVYTSRLGILSAEEITQSIIMGGLKIDAMYTIDSVDTLGVAQALVDFNKVGQIVLVGYGDTPEISRYIEKGIIYGTVMSDPYLMGYQSIKSLMEIKEKNNVSTFIDTDIKVLTRENLVTEQGEIKRQVNP